jgi:hypothetical protein
MSLINPYINFTNWISEILEDSENSKKININKVIKKAKRLPTPDSEEKYQNLFDAGFCYSLNELASYIGNFFYSDTASSIANHNKNEIKKSLNSDLTTLWKIWEKNCFIFGADKFIAFLHRSEKYRKRLFAFGVLYNAFRDRVLNEDKSENSNDHLFREYFSLSRASVIGYEGFVDAAEKLGNEIVFEKVWKLWLIPNDRRMQMLWFPLIGCARKFKRSDILKEIWRNLKISYREIDQFIIQPLLVSAMDTGVDEILDYFETLNTPSYWDLSTHYDPFVDEILSKSSLENYKTSCEKVKFRSLQGLFWRLYIKEYFDEGILKADNYFHKLKSVLRLSENNLNNWNSTICLAQETYARELRSRLYSEFKNQFSYLNNIDVENCYREIKAGTVSLKIKNYQEKVSQFIAPLSYIALKDEILENKFLPFINCFLSNHMSFLKDRENFCQWQSNEESKDVFFRRVEKHFLNIDTENISDEEWQYLVHLLLNQIKVNIDNYFSDLFLGELHSLKRTFAKKFEKPLQNDSITDSDKYHIVENARNFIMKISHHLPNYRIMETKSIDIYPEVEKHLLRDYLNTADDIFDTPTRFCVAGYDGICEDYLKPMLIEIRSNAEKALSYLPQQDQKHFQVNLKRVWNEYSDYGILSVTNNFIKTSNSNKSDPISTGIGLKNIQYYATFFQLGTHRGWAQFKKNYRKGKHFFIVQVFLPLWKSR